MMRSVYSLRSLNVLAAVVVTLVCADVASAQEDGAAGLAAAGAAVELAYIGIGLTVIGSAFGIGRLAEWEVHPRRRIRGTVGAGNGREGDRAVLGLVGGRGRGRQAAHGRTLGRRLVLLRKRAL